ncbi:MAG: hypothetical protein CL840_21765 [Crocinitomicaceae bacterium]|nr:hypothetical protein [Crocinitomicaceae bacterium]|tara:strand:+ start:13454 stop:13846 length:393 start_codon:yes stop_codon:yes gene_type:complete
MTKSQYFRLIDTTISLGVDLIFNRFSTVKFNQFKKNKDTIVQNGKELLSGFTQLRTCEILESKEVEQFKLSPYESWISLPDKNYMGKIKSTNKGKNTEKRFIADVIAYLPILKSQSNNNFYNMDTNNSTV